MFGSCAGANKQVGHEDDDPRRPKRREGQRRELMVKQAERVPRRILVANISEIEEQLSEEERDYEAKAAQREEERLHKQEALKKKAIAKAISGASGQLSGSLFSRMQGLAKLQEVARSALNTEFGRLTTAGEDPDQGISMDEMASTPAPLKMPVPEAPWVTIKVTHPCAVSLLRSKLSRTLATPLENIRIVHRHKALKDEDFVPDDTVDLGEQELAEDVLAENGPALSYLWVVDESTLESRSSVSSSASTAGLSKEKLMKTKSSRKSQSITGVKTLEGEGNPDPSDEGDSVGDSREEEQAENKSEEEAAAAATGRKKDGTLLLTPQQLDNNEEQEAPKRDDDAPSVGENMFRRTGTHQKQTGSSSSTGGGASKIGVVTIPKLGIEGGDDAAGAADTAANLLVLEGKEGVSTARVVEAKKKRKERVVPGSLLLTSVSASDLPDTEKGMFSKQDPYVIFKWAEQEARTTVRRDAGKNCSWPKEELALIVRNKTQLQEPVEVEVWNDNTGDKKPGPDVLVGKGHLLVEHLSPAPDEPPTISGSSKKRDARAGAAEGVVNGRGEVVTVHLLRGGKRRRRKEKHVGLVSLTLLYTSPRKKPPKAKRNEEAGGTGGGGAAADERTMTTRAEDEAMSSIAGLSAWSSRDKRNTMSVQELGAVMSQTLEGFNIREELSKIDCLRYAQGFIDEGFGQRGAFANIREEHMAGHPMFVPRGARKRLLALSELIRLQLKAEEDKAQTVMDTLKREAVFEGRYTVDGRRFFDTLAGMKETLGEEEKREAAKQMAAQAKKALIEDEDAPPQRKPPKPRTAAKEKVIRAIEATAAAEERGVFQPAAMHRAHTEANNGRRRRNEPAAGGGDGDEGPCCEKHAFRIERSALHMLDEQVKDTSLKVNTWLDRADRFKNGFVPKEAVATVMRDAFHLNGLPSPRESDVRTSLDRVSREAQGLHFDRDKLALELERMVRTELML